MRALLQRVKRAKVTVDGVVSGEIGTGLLVLLGVSQTDTEKEAEWLVNKIAALRVFTDSEGKMNLSVVEVGGALLVVSQFTLYGDTRKGRRPSYDQAARPEEAKRLYEDFVARARAVLRVETGVFQAHMDVELVNDGPVTLWCDTSTPA